MISVICNQSNPFFCTKLLRFSKSKDHCNLLLRDFYYIVLHMSLTYFPAFPQMDGYETLFADDFYYVCLLCWFPIMVEWYAKKLTATAHYSKSQIFVQNSILTKPQHFHEFFTQFFFGNFSREIKVVNS